MNNKICYDENNPMRECPTINMSPCVQPKGMGGHPGAFTNVHIRSSDGECKIACGKKISGDSIKEYEFYKKLFTTQNLPHYLENLKKFLPTFYIDDKCNKSFKTEKKESSWFGLYNKKIISHHTNNYFIIDNIMSAVGSEPKNLDFKIGFKTAFQFDKGFMGATRHRLLDNDNFSTSNRYGFRLEGATDIDELVKKAKTNPNISNYKKTSLERGKKKQQIALYHLDPEFVFDNFFDSKNQAIELFNELKLLWSEFLEPNINAASRGEQSVAFIGSSILIVKGKDKITFKLIDFAHPLWNSKETFNEHITQHRHNKVVENYTQGLRNLISLVGAWIDKNQTNIKPVTTNNLQIIKGGKRRKKRKTRRKKYKKKRKTYRKKSRRYKR
jgi:hypothetical protein